MTEEIGECTHLITDKVRRTVKFLSALSCFSSIFDLSGELIRQFAGMGLQIVSVEWIEQSAKVKNWLEEEKFIIEDEEAEAKWSFNLRSSIAHSREERLLADLYIYATTHTKPPPKEIADITAAAGGSVSILSCYFIATNLLQILKQLPSKHQSNVIVISCEEDRLM